MMKQSLIDANALEGKIAKLFLEPDYQHTGESWRNGLHLALEAVYELPTVEIVRCKDCKNWWYEYDDVGLCITDVPDIDGVQRLAYDFCSCGEKKS